MYKILMAGAVCAAMAGSAYSQTLQRKATFLGGGSADRGKCTIEVVVDTAAEVEIRGDGAVLRTIAGQPAQWRRLECTGALPQNPTNFRFEGIDGRGRQNLVGDPRSNGSAVIRIEDTSGGAEGYTFDIMWGNGYAQGPNRNDQGGQRLDSDGDGRVEGRFEGNRGDDRRDNDGRFDGDRGPGRGRRFATQHAVRVCEESILRQATRRFRTDNIEFRGTALDNNPGRQDWVMGVFEVNRLLGRDESYRFACSVNFDNGQVRTARIGQRVQRARR